MGAWRVGVLALVGVAVCLPLAQPLAQAFVPENWPAPATLGRAGALMGNALALIGGALLLALPAGVALAVLLERTDLPGRGFVSGALLAPLALPLPLWLSGWLQFGGTVAPIEFAARLVPWLPGLGPAVLFHALAGLPWVVLIVSWGLRAGGEWEEHALTVGGPWWVLWRVTLPRAGGAIAAAAMFVAVQAAGEMTITDLFQLRTFAEEVYTQYVLPEPDGLGDPQGRAVVLSLGWVALAAALAVWLFGGEGEAPASYRQAPVFRLGAWRWPVLALVSLIALALVGVPLGGLAWRAGGWPVYAEAWRSDGGLLVGSLAESAVAGLLSAGAALPCAWLAREGRWFRWAVLAIAAVAWTMPAPVLGLGMKEMFKAALDWLGNPGWLLYLVWNGPSYFPVGWVALVRTFPFALAVVWPAVRRVPRELLEAARLDGQWGWAELRRVVWPLAWPAWLAAWGAAALLSLGELGAAKMVSTPGAETFAELVWGQLHYGVTAGLAARCLLLAAVALAGGAGLAWARGAGHREEGLGDGPSRPGG